MLKLTEIYKQILKEVTFKSEINKAILKYIRFEEENEMTTLSKYLSKASNLPVGNYNKLFRAVELPIKLLFGENLNLTEDTIIYKPKTSFTSWSRDLTGIDNIINSEYFSRFDDTITCIFRSSNLTPVLDIKKWWSKYRNYFEDEDDFDDIDDRIHDEKEVICKSKDLKIKHLYAILDYEDEGYVRFELGKEHSKMTKKVPNL